MELENKDGFLFRFETVQALECYDYSRPSLHAQSA
jgi:hypothetical protein